MKIKIMEDGALEVRTNVVVISWVVSKKRGDGGRQDRRRFRLASQGFGLEIRMKTSAKTSHRGGWTKQ